MYSASLLFPHKKAGENGSTIVSQTSCSTCPIQNPGALERYQYESPLRTASTNSTSMSQLRGYESRMPHDGILGTDHLDSTRAIINYDTFTLNMKFYNEEFPIFRAYELEPRSRTILAIETQPTDLSEGLIELKSDNPETFIVPQINSVSNNQTQIVVINTFDHPESIVLPRSSVSVPTRILAIERGKGPQRLPRESLTPFHTALSTPNSFSHLPSPTRARVQV